MDNAGRSAAAGASGVLGAAPRRQICTFPKRCNSGHGRREALNPATFETVRIGTPKVLFFFLKLSNVIVGLRPVIQARNDHTAVAWISYVKAPGSSPKCQSWQAMDRAHAIGLSTALTDEGCQCKCTNCGTDEFVVGRRKDTGGNSVLENLYFQIGSRLTVWFLS